MATYTCISPCVLCQVLQQSSIRREATSIDSVNPRRLFQFVLNDIAEKACLTLASSLARL